MSDKTGISWTDATWNPLRGCRRVSPECEHCYAEKVAGRFHGPGEAYEGLVTLGKHGYRWNGKVHTIEKHMFDPLHWRRPREIFVNSMSDLFYEEVSDTFIALVFSIMAKAHWHRFQILTKRGGRMRDWFETKEACAAKEEARSMGQPWPLPNVWLGVSVGLQDYMYRVAELLSTPAAVKFVSAEPLIGPLDFTNVPCPGEHEPGENCPVCGGRGKIDAFMEGLDWVITGCESGAGARPMDDDWARSIRDQCNAASVPFYLKQMRVDGVKTELPFLDGRQWMEKPRTSEVPATTEA